METEPVLLALPGTMCSPAVFEPLAAELAGTATVHSVSWLTEPGPWDIPAVAARTAAYIEGRWARPLLVCGHSTTGPGPRSRGRELAAGLPDAEFRLAEAGHTPIYETPAFVAAAVRDLLTRHPWRTP